jgi:hypothetical protein
MQLHSRWLGCWVSALVSGLVRLRLCLPTTVVLHRPDTTSIIPHIDQIKHQHVSAVHPFTWKHACRICDDDRALRGESGARGGGE